MCANRDIWLEKGDLFDEWGHIQTVKHQPHPIRLPWLVARLVPPPEEGRGLRHQLRVELGIEVLEETVRVIQRIHRADLRDIGHPLEGLFQGVCGDDMPGTGAGRENQDPFALVCHRLFQGVVAQGGEIAGDHHPRQNPHGDRQEDPLGRLP